MATRTLEIVLAGDPASASRAFRRTEQDAGRMGKALDREGKRVHGFATITSKGFARVGAASSAMSAVAGGAVALLAKNFVNSATSINESLSKNEVLFGKHAASVERFSQRTAKSLGVSRQATLEATGTFGNLFTALEIGPRQSAKMSVALTRLAADMASFNNASPEETLEAIRAGLVGETEPLRRFGVNLNDATLRAEALRMGLVKSTKEALEPQTKALAVNSLLFKQTEKAQGDFQRTSGGLANQQRILKARLSDVGAELGSRLMPFALRAVGALNDLITETQRGRGPLIRLKNAVADVVDATKDAVGWFRRHKTTSDVLLSTVVGLTAAFVAYKVAIIAAAVATRGLTFAALALNLALRANPIGLVVTAVIALGAALVTAYHRSDTFRKIVDKAFDGAKRGARVAADVFDNVLKPAFDTIVSAANKVWNILKKVGGVLGSIGGAASDAAGFLNPFGDGLGKFASSMDITGLGGTGGLMGADPDLGPFASVGARYGLHVSSGIRPGAITSSGNKSYHSSGDAIDMAGSPGAMMGFFQFARKNMGGRLRELIYTPGGIGIKDGKPYQYSGQVAADHHDHVHLAYTGPFGDGLGRFDSTSYGPPWGGIQGTGTTATGVNLKGGPKRYGVAVDPNVIKLGSMLKITPNPFGYSGAFEAFDTGGAIKGRRIDFYDWRGRKAQLNWGHRMVSISTVDRNSRGGGGGGGGGPRAEGGGTRGETPSGPGAALGMEGQLARVGVRKASAEARDNLSGFIKALVDERAIKRRRLKAIRKVLRGRLTKARRTRLLQEEATLIGEIGDLTDSIKEYRADQRGGATTITRADELDAGVDTSVDTGGGGGADTGGGTDNTSAAIAELTAAIDRQNKLNEWLVRTQGPTLVGAVLAAVNGGIGGPVGLSLQGIRSAPGSVAGL